MKNFLHWFKNSTKVKRWIFLILVGMFLICYGFAKIFTSESLGIKSLLEVIITFVAGFVVFIIGLIYIQRRTIELALEANKEDNKDLGVNNLVLNKNVYEKGPKVVVIGGGNGLNNVLQGLKNYTSNITAIIAVSSYGKKQPDIIKDLNLKPVEEIKDSIIALSQNSNEMSKLLKYKFNHNKLNNIEFGDIYLSAMQNVYGDFANSIEKTSSILSITGKVLPVTLDEMNICAELQDGTVVEEKDKISEIVSSKVTKINRVYINPSNCRTAPGVLEAIKDADAIVMGPGSLYTNVIPNLLIKNVAKTIRESNALKIYISNIMTEPGQTDDYELSDHINAIIEHSGEGIIDFCICNEGSIVPEFIRKYNLAGSTFVDADYSKVRNKGIRIIEENISTIKDEYIRHNSDKISKAIIEIICGDLKYKDKHSDEQYLILNSKLKDEKKKEKEENKQDKKEEKEKPKSKHRLKKESKFNVKYKERIQSIKESENIRQQNIKIHKKAKELINEEEKKAKKKFLEETYSKKQK